MSTMTTAVIGLKDSTLEKLRELRRLNVDSAKGFDECADILKDDDLAGVFRQIAVKRRAQAQQLETQIEWNDQVEPEEGSYVAAMHRAWVNVLAAVSSDDKQAVLNEAERGEDQIKAAYEDALSDCAGSPIHELIADQAVAVKNVHDRVKALRDACKC